MTYVLYAFSIIVFLSTCLLMIFEDKIDKWNNRNNFIPGTEELRNGTVKIPTSNPKVWLYGKIKKVMNPSLHNFKQEPVVEIGSILEFSVTGIGIVNVSNENYKMGIHRCLSEIELPYAI